MSHVFLLGAQPGLPRFFTYSASTHTKPDCMPNGIDIHENHILNFSPEVLELLLADHTTGGRILWATHDYEALGPEYAYRAEIQPRLITGEHGMVIRPRVVKSREEQAGRVRGMAEVFTPAWVVRKMVDTLDIDVGTRCMEITCGEAPFLSSRYDTTTGDPIAIGDRVGVLDRKMRLLDGQQLADDEWLAQVRLTFQTTYGYEWQGDSLLLARENHLYTFIDHYAARFGEPPDVGLLLEFADVISWNLWQMDGLSYCTPREKNAAQPTQQTSLFADAPTEAPPPFCLIKDWQKNQTIKVIEIKNNNTMKFDVIIGNPPYQDEVLGDNQQFAPPVYNLFIDEAQKVADQVELIHPARFLFNAGSTPRDWNEKILNNEHFKVLDYISDASTVFNNTDIKGGVAITYYDRNTRFEPIKLYTPYSELNSVYKKASPKNVNESLSSIVFPQNKFNLESLYADHPEFRDLIGSNGNDKRFRSNIFDKISIFYSERRSNNEIPVIGVISNKRVWRYIDSKYVDIEHQNLKTWKLILPEAAGNGSFGEPLGNVMILEPNTAFTQTFFSIGNFSKKNMVEALLKYVKTKFARALLGILKVTQHIHKETWAYVPLQDFTSNSDIDWSKSIDEIDEQLFDKYGLDEKECEFIRTKVKEMK